MSNSYPILMVTDSHAKREAYVRQLRVDDTFVVLAEWQEVQLLQVCQSQPVNAILLELSSLWRNRLTALKSLQQHMGEACPPVIAIGEDKCDIAVQAFRQGVTDYLIEAQMTPEDLRLALHTAIDKAQLQRQRFDRQSQELELSQTIATLQKQQHRLNQDLTNRIGELETLLDTIPVGIAIASDPSCRQMQYNAYLRQLLGTPTGANISKSAPPDEQPAYRVFQQGEEVPADNLPMQVAARLGIEVRDAEYEVLLPDGTMHQVLVYATPLRDNQHQIRGAVGAVLDITQRKQFTAALQASQQRYRELAEAMPQMVWTADATGAIDYWNQQWYEYTGGSETESLGLAGITTVHPDDRDRTLDQWNRAITQQESYEIEYRIRRHDGIYHWFMCRGLPIRNDQGEVVSWIGTITDIDNQKRLENQFSQVLKAVNGLVFDWNLETNEVYRSEKLFDLVGIRPEDVPASATWWHDRCHAEDMARLQDKLPNLLANSNNLYEGEYRVRHEDGHWVDVWERGCVVRDKQGTATRIVGSTVDISQLKRAELKLREAHIQLEAALTAGLIYTWRWNIPDDLVFADRNFADLFGVDPQAAVLGLPIEQFLSAIHPDDRASVVAAVERAIATGEDYTAEYRVCNGEEERWVIARGRVEYDANGTPIAFPGALADITNRKHAEVALKESEERFQKLVTYLPLVFWMSEPLEQRLIYASPAYETVWGRSLQALYADYAEWSNAIHPDDRDRVTAYLKDFALHYDYNIEYRIVRPDGSVRWIADRAIPITQEAGEAYRVAGIAEDITERKAAEEKRRESEEELRYTIELNPQVTWKANPLGEIVDFSDRWLALTGLTRTQASGEGWTQTPHPDDLPMMMAAWNASMTTGKPYDVEHRVKRADGSYIWMRSRAFPRRNDQGAIIRWYGTTEDIDDRKRSEKVIADNEARLRGFVEANVIGMLHGDIYGNIYSANDELLRIVGYTREDLQAGRLRWIDITPPEHLPIDEQSVAEARANGACTPYEKEYIRKDGSRVPVFIGYSLVGEKREESVAFILDISDRKQAETALQERTNHIQLLYEISRDLLSSTQPLALIESIVDKLKGMMGLDIYLNYVLDESQQKLQLTFYGGIQPDVAHPIESIEVGQAVCGRVAQQRSQLVYNDVQHSNEPETQLVRSLGVTAYACQPLIAQNKLLGTISFGSLSRTHFSASEQALFQAICDQIAIALERSELLNSLQRQTEELTRVNRIKDEFLAVLSHELRSPLNPILGWTKLLQSRKLDPTRTAEALAVIERNAKLQTQLIDDLLDIAKILRGKLILEVTPVNLVFVVEAAIDTMRSAAIAKNISLNSMFAQIGLISGDAVRLQQIIWNLLSNAIKFTPNQGRVDIQLEQVGNQAQITVTDTGKGINPDFLPHIFESFRQEDASTTRKFGGLGLGLAIVRQLVEAHGGTITATSPGEGLGSTFIVRLPLLPIEAKNSHPEVMVESENDLTGIRILIVEDEPDARDLLAVLLSHYGADVMIATCATEVLAGLESFNPTLLISDIGMPGTDGYSLIQQIRTLPPDRGGNVLAIALTAYAGEINSQRALAAGFQRHLAKPLEPQMLVSTITELVLPLVRPIAPSWQFKTS